MTVWTGVEYFNFALDSLNDLTGSTFALGLVHGTYPVTGQFVTDTGELARLALNPKPVPAGHTRYWWKALLGAGQTIELLQGENTVYARLTDSPEVIPYEYKIRTPYL
jgi:hypothetical protein